MILRRVISHFSRHLRPGQRATGTGSTEAHAPLRSRIKRQDRGSARRHRSMTWAQRLKRVFQIDIPSGPVGHRTQSMGSSGYVLARRPRIDVMVGPVRTAI